MILKEKNINIAFYVAITASLISCISDVLLLYAPGQDYLKGDYIFYGALDRSSMMLGHYLGVIFIPLQVLAIPWLSKHLKIENNKPSPLIAIVLFYSIIMGCIYHASCAFMGIGLSDKLPYADVVELYNSLYVPFAIIFIMGLGYISYYVGLIIFKGKTGFKKSLGFFVPINIAILIYLTDLLTYIDMGLLTVSAFNLSILLFLICAAVLKKKENLTA